MGIGEDKEFATFCPRCFSELDEDTSSSLPYCHTCGNHWLPHNQLRLMDVLIFRALMWNKL